MPTIPALTTISGEISASPHNNNYATIRTYVNDYAVFKDVATTVSATLTFTSGITVSSGTTTTQAISATTGAFSSTVAVTGDLTANTHISTSGSSLVLKATGVASIDFWTNGSARIVLTSSGHFVPSADNSYDCGISGNAWRDFFVGRNAQVGGTFVATGAVTCQSTLAVTGTTTLQAVTCTTMAPSSTLTLSQSGTTPALEFSGANPRIEMPSGTLTIVAGGTGLHFLEPNGNFVIGNNTAIATTSADAWLVIPRSNGHSTGNPTYIGTLRWDQTNKKLEVFDGSSWLATAALT